MYGRTYNAQRFSPLKQINEQSVAKLGLAWSRELGTTRGLEATPLVDGKPIWYAPKLECSKTAIDLDHQFDGGSGIAYPFLRTEIWRRAKKKIWR